MRTKNKAHLLYMTGLSIDKNRMNDITENINFDKDYTYWRIGTEKEFEKVFSRFNTFLGNINKFGKKQIEIIFSSITDIGEIINIFDNQEVIEGISDTEINTGLDKIRKKLTKYPKSFLTKTLEFIGYKDVENISHEHNMLLQKYMRSYAKFLGTFTNGDFFSLYMSNQSDSIGLVPLAKLSTNNKFNIHHSYCDYDFYDNKYIDSIIIRLDKSKYKDLDIEKINNVFKMHIRELMFSMAVLKHYKENKDNKKNDDIPKSIYDIILNSDTNERLSKVDVVQMLGERNFFGVALLSYILQLIENFRLDKKQKLSIKIDEDNNSAEYHFLKEVIEYSCDPLNTGFKNENSSMGVKIYFSDGLKLLSKGKKIEEKSHHLLHDGYFKFMYKELKKLDLNHRPDQERGSELISKKYIKTTDHTEESYNKKDEDLLYVSEVENEIYIKVPIKMMLSLPLSELNNEGEQVPNSDLYIPECIDNKDKNLIDILTVGGTEHNRALAHLINKYRWEYNQERIFGFMDNVFDMDYKIKNENTTYNMKFERSFFMGLNQPVSGWNYVLNARTNDEYGNSVNSDVKFLKFNITKNNRTFQVVSIYGFSAIASVIGINHLVSNFPKISKEGELFKESFEEIFLLGLQKKYGTSSAVYFKNNPKKIIMYEMENKCYQYVFNYKRKKYNSVLVLEQSKSKHIDGESDGILPYTLLHKNRK